MTKISQKQTFISYCFNNLNLVFKAIICSSNLLKLFFNPVQIHIFIPFCTLIKITRRDLLKPSFRKCGSCFSPFSKFFVVISQYVSLIDYFFILQWSLDCHDLQDSTRSVYLRGGRQSRRCDLFLTSLSASPSQVWPPTPFYYV